MGDMLLPLQPSPWREIRGRDLKEGVVFFAPRLGPVKVLSRPQIVRRGFAYLVGNWGFPEATLQTDVEILTEGARYGTRTTIRVWSFALFKKPKRRVLPRL